MIVWREVRACLTLKPFHALQEEIFYQAVQIPEPDPFETYHTD